jgi:hypothetical protein
VRVVQGRCAPYEARPRPGPERRAARRHAPTPDHIDIPLQELLVYEGDELIVESANPATHLDE